jgi:hypothetical protein
VGRIGSVRKEKKMNTYRFHLEKYKNPSSRHTCPACKQKRVFVRYLDSDGIIRFPDYVGRCNREQKCGYHYTPKQYFADNPTGNNLDVIYSSPLKAVEKVISPDYLPLKLVAKSMKHYERNHLFQFFLNKYGKVTTCQLFKKYRVGTANHWNGASIFWQLDVNDNVRTGKIMLYDSQTGKRIKKPHSHITWVHSLMKLENYNLKQCFFGEHLLKENRTLPVAVVESEKTALIASIYIPEYIWIATGGKNGSLNKDNMQILKNRKVVLFPDLGAKEYWSKKSEQMQELNIDVVVSDYLERNANAEQIEEGYDIADFLLQSSLPQNTYQMFLEKNPALGQLISALDLKLVEVSTLFPNVPFGGRNL